MTIRLPGVEWHKPASPLNASGVSLRKASDSQALYCESGRLRIPVPVASVATNPSGLAIPKPQRTFLLLLHPSLPEKLLQTTPMPSNQPVRNPTRFSDIIQQTRTEMRVLRRRIQIAYAPPQGTPRHPRGASRSVSASASDRLEPIRSV